MTLRLVVYPDGHAILELPPNVTPETAIAFRDAWREWADGEGRQLLMLAGTVELATTVRPDGALELRHAHTEPHPRCPSCQAVTA